jgi:hypothetical protein
MVLLQKEHNAVLEFNALGLVGLEVVQPGRGNLFPGLGLLGGERAWKLNQSRDEEHPAQK